MTSVRFPFRIFNRSRKKQRVINCGLQGQSSGYVAFQNANNGGNVLHLTGLASSNGGYGSQGDGYEAVYMAGGRGLLEINNGQGISGYSNGLSAQFHAGNVSYGHGFVAHDGSSKIFIWDATKGCMVPYRESIGRRLRRSVDAFARAWRLGHG